MEMKRSSTRGEPDVLVEKVAKTASEEIEWRNKKNEVLPALAGRSEAEQSHP
jgi:hypothetical protein